MTAEIAILNRTAVALAADSIVTISGPGSSKTYDSAEKIFELSHYQPIGLMIYNNAEFMNAPLEIIARRFRETLTSGQFAALVQVWPVFETFLLAFPRELEDECTHLESLLDVEFSQMREAQFNEMVKQLSFPKGKGTKQEPDAFFLDLAKKRRIELRRTRIDKFLESTSEANFAGRYGDCVEEVAKLAFDKLSDALLKELQGFAFDLVRSSTLSDAHTGFVIAGLGHNDIFPSLNHIKCDGIYFGELRVVGEREVTDIDRRGLKAELRAFAQTDMPERFIDGIDSEFEQSLEKLVDNMTSDLVTQLSGSADITLTEKIRETANQSIRNGIGRLKNLSRKELSSVVAHLSKKELGEFAYSLVELTSRKRRYSSQQETVGGPIDVAILTRNEGFVWVRRKHYFDVSLNPGFQKRNGK
ncbi:hypothetical protein [Sphingorhabdus sp. SMR4y]|uniref:hypothetical protein n=1 Tax=Sphingorhabdus sp. SMR4y TaxID=2584094 RepID=UPI000B5CB5AC|nr:hypothetical protein [Sphingorhabdus sp. SMR4y]ASK89634.1 hypothetical protein SPHFLASMR4Y_02901 [Sphingorhabdus sp. SMR4y]